jgi:hypothetical protein
LNGKEAKIHLEGFAREQSDALGLNELFLADGMPVAERPEKKGEYYKWSFEKEVRLMTVKAQAGKAKSAGAGSVPGRSSAPPAAQPPVAQPAGGRPAASKATPGGGASP